MMVASTVFPFLNLNIQRPMKTAIGMVLAMVKVPQGTFRKGVYHTIPSPAMAIMINNIRWQWKLSHHSSVFFISRRGNFGQRFPIVPDRGSKDHDIMNGTGQYSFPEPSIKTGEDNRTGMPGQARPAARLLQWQQNDVRTIPICSSGSNSDVVKTLGRGHRVSSSTRTLAVIKLK